jgi:membrane protease YdiL (CAAX protease family)
MAFIILVCLCAAIATGLFRARSVSGPFRLAPGYDSLWRLLFAAAVGCFFWIASQGFVAHPGGATAATSPAMETNHSAREWAFLSTVPFVLGFMAIVVSDTTMLGLSGVKRLGLRADWVRGMAKGLLGIIIAFPLVFFVSEVTDSIYQSLHYAHPQEHELLKVMDESGQGPVRIALIVGAVLLAPLFEETLFRGHVQTFFRELFCRWSGVLDQRQFSDHKAAPHPNPLPGIPGRGDQSEAQADATAPRPLRTAGWQTWLAILLTSVLFALVHPAWMRPTIFFLAICLGYAYERTGNLWTNILMHAIFNAVNTYLFLNTDH